MSCREQMVPTLATCMEDEEDNYTTRRPLRSAPVINRSPLFQRLALQHDIICIYIFYRPKTSKANLHNAGYQNQAPKQSFSAINNKPTINRRKH